MAHKPEELQEVLHYTFKNPALLRIALTHTSYANESKVATTHNERLEFLGDSVLSVVVADYLFHQSGRPEGELTRMRASLVSEDALFQFAQEIQLGEYLRLGHGEDLGGGRSRPSVVSDAFEAVIAALYLDGGMEAARNFILPFITEGKTAEDDYKTRLQEVVQQDPSAVLKYDVYAPNTKVSGNEVGAEKSFTSHTELAQSTIGIGGIYNFNKHIRLQAYYEFNFNEKSNLVKGYENDWKDNVLTVRLQYKF